MEKNLVIIKNNYPGKQLGNLKYRFEYYLILEKIFREISFINDFESFIRNIFELLHIYHPELDFFVDIFGEFEIGTNDSDNTNIIFKSKLNYFKDQFGEFRIKGDKINRFEREIFEKIISHICIYYMFYINRELVNPELLANIINDLEDIEKIFKNMLNSLQFFLHEDIECENIYIFLRQHSKLKYSGNLYNKHTEFSGKENNIISDVLEKRFSIRSNIIEFSKEEKIELSRTLGINVKNILVVPVRSTEELLGYVILTNIFDHSAEKEKILDLYTVYFEKIFLSINKNSVELNREGMLTMYSLAAKMLEEENNDNLNPLLERFFLFFKKFFNLNNINIFSIKDDDFNLIYSTSHFFNEKVLKQRLLQKKGKIIFSEKDQFNFSFFEQENIKCGLFAYEANEDFDEQDKNNVENFANLIFNIMYSRKNLENIRELDRLAVLGRMAREMAHEIRNPLGGIRLFIEMLKKKNENSSNNEIFESILKGIDNINSVITGMLEFTGSSHLDMKEENIVEILHDSIKLVPQLKDIRITYNIEKQDILCIIDKEKITRVFLNILKNAVEAMEGIEDPHIRIEIILESQKVILTIWNNGGEIVENQKNKIFSPFFTTKKKGNGIGLCVSRKIINEHKGEINLKTVNGWTGFEITLKGMKI